LLSHISQPFYQAGPQAPEKKQQGPEGEVLGGEDFLASLLQQQQPEQQPPPELQPQQLQGQLKLQPQKALSSEGLEEGLLKNEAQLMGDMSVHLDSSQMRRLDAIGPQPILTSEISSNVGLDSLSQSHEKPSTEISQILAELKKESPDSQREIAKESQDANQRLSSNGIETTPFSQNSLRGDAALRENPAEIFASRSLARESFVEKNQLKSASNPLFLFENEDAEMEAPDSVRNRSPFSVSTEEFLNTRHSLHSAKPNGSGAGMGMTLKEPSQFKEISGDSSQESSRIFAGAKPEFSQNPVSDSSFKLDAQVTPGALSRERFSSESINGLTGQIDRIAKGVKEGEIRVRLSPGNLGEMTLHVKSLGNRVELSVMTAQEGTERILQESLPFLREALAKQSLILEAAKFSPLLVADKAAVWMSDAEAGRSPDDSPNQGNDRSSFGGEWKGRDGQSAQDSYGGSGRSEHGLRANVLGDAIDVQKIDFSERRFNGRLDVRV
jgi:flagellar hook-length control protein FliK